MREGYGDKGSDGFVLAILTEKNRRLDLNCVDGRGGKYCILCCYADEFVA